MVVRGSGIENYFELFDSLRLCVSWQPQIEGSSLELNNHALEWWKACKSKDRPTITSLLQFIPQKLLLIQQDDLLVWEPEEQSLSLPEVLTPSEREVYRWLILGKRASEIAIMTQRSVRTIEKHTESIFRKLDISSTQHLILRSLVQK